MVHGRMSRDQTMHDIYAFKGTMFDQRITRRIIQLILMDEYKQKVAKRFSKETVVFNE